MALPSIENTNNNFKQNIRFRVLTPLRKVLLVDSILWITRQLCLVFWCLDIADRAFSIFFGVSVYQSISLNNCAFYYILLFGGSILLLSEHCFEYPLMRILFGKTIQVKLDGKLIRIWSGGKSSPEFLLSDGIAFVLQPFEISTRIEYQKSKRLEIHKDQKLIWVVDEIFDLKRVGIVIDGLNGLLELPKKEIEIDVDPRSQVFATKGVF